MRSVVPSGPSNGARRAPGAHGCRQKRKSPIRPQVRMGLPGTNPRSASTCPGSRGDGARDTRCMTASPGHESAGPVAGGAGKLRRPVDRAPRRTGRKARAPSFPTSAGSAAGRRPKGDPHSWVWDPPGRRAGPVGPPAPSSRCGGSDGEAAPWRGCRSRARPRGQPDRPGPATQPHAGPWPLLPARGPGEFPRSSPTREGRLHHRPPAGRSGAGGHPRGTGRGPRTTMAPR